MNYFRTNFCDRIVCLVTSFSVGHSVCPSENSTWLLYKMQIYRIFFFFPVFCCACSVFLPLTSYFLILFCPSFFLPFLFSPFIVQAEHLLSLWDLLSNFFSATYAWRKNIYFSLLSSVSGEKREHHNIVLNLYKVREEAVHLVTCDWFQLNRMLIYIDKYL